MLLLSQNNESDEFLLLNAKTLHPLLREKFSIRDVKLTSDFMSYRFSNEHARGSSKLDILDLHNGERTTHLNSFNMGMNALDEFSIIGDIYDTQSVLKITKQTLDAEHIQFRSFHND